jgi:hypothetical protein
MKKLVAEAMLDESSRTIKEKFLSCIPMSKALRTMSLNDKSTVGTKKKLNPCTVKKKSRYIHDLKNVLSFISGTLNKRNAVLQKNLGFTDIMYSLPFKKPDKFKGFVLLFTDDFA